MPIILDGTDSIGDLGDALAAKFTTPTAWTTYTPATTGMALGNASVSASYTQIGKTVHVQVFIKFGSTTTLGTDPNIGLPIAARDMELTTGTAIYVDVSANSAKYMGAWRYGYLTREGGPWGQAGASSPFIWAVNDIILLSLTYEAA